jgi:glucose-6-phosphate isomerase
VLLGLLGVWNASILGRPTRAVLPYSQGLVRFAAHIQQLEMESNGKHVTTDGAPTPFPTGEVIFGEPGTNGQHSFYQLIHQSTEIIPCEFIGFAQSQTPINHVGFNSTKTTEVVPNHDELMSNFFAQPDALAYGKTVAELEAEGVKPALIAHKEFAGNRPSTSLLFNKLTPFTCGQLLALYEHRVAVQGFIWGINSFDQWGVELGKVLAVRVRGTLAAANAQVVDAAVGAVSGEGATLTEVDVSKLDMSGYNASTQSLLAHYLKNKF